MLITQKQRILQNDLSDPEVKVSTLARQSEESFPDYLETARFNLVFSCFKVREAVTVNLQFISLLRERKIFKRKEA